MEIIKFLKTLKSNNIDVSLHKGDLEISFDGDELPSHFLIEIKKNKELILSFLQNLGDNSSSDIIQNVPIQDDYVVSSSQKRLWILSQFEEASIAYNLVDLFELHGDLDINALESALKKVIARHEILRTNFRENALGDVRQVITSIDEFDYTLHVTDLSNYSSDELNTLISKEIETPFNLSFGHLFRTKLFSVSEKKYVFCFVLHHIITDGWSMRLLINELFMLYSSLCTGRDISLDPLLIQYKDYAAWQQEQLIGDKLISHRNYWLDQFSGGLSNLNFPGDKTRPSIKTYNGSILGKYLGKKIKNDLRKLIQNTGTTLYMGILAGVYALLYKYTRSTDITIGTPIAGRENVDLEDQLGFYVNTLALRTKFSADDSFTQLLNNIKKVTMDAYDHQIYPFDSLIEELSLKRDTSRNALFDIMVVLQNTDIAIASKQIDNLGNIKVVNYEGVNNIVSKLDLTFNFNESDEDLFASIEYNNDIYSEGFCSRILDNLIHLFEVVLSTPDILIREIDYQDELSKVVLLEKFNETALVYESGRSLSIIFERQVLLTPDSVALRYKDISLTYKTLNERSNRLSSYLLSNYDLSSQDLISLKLPRSEWQLISILAVLKSGCAYVPIDIDYPEERVEHIIKDSCSKLLIDEKEITNFIIEEEDCSSENKVCSIHSSDLAYVIYTSGTTGLPKGVMVEQSSVINLIESQKTTFGIKGDENILQFSSISFDASVEQIFLALSSGSSLTIIDKEVLLTPQGLEIFILDNGITHLHAVPSILKTIEAKKYPALRRVISGGDSCTKELALSWLPYHEFYNEYGPTETTVTSIMHLCSESGLLETLPIGRPIGNTQVYILDTGLKLVPIGIIGDIYISGSGLSRGYLNQPELTKEKFISNPFKASTQMYKTGDLGRWQSNGTIEFIGRLDDQVKIRGYRIELGEIESAILGYGGISTAVVLAMDTGAEEKELIAYIDIDTEEKSQDLRAYLLQKLPTYMVPAHFVRMSVFPVNSNGKIDRKQLPSPEGLEMLSGVEYIAPRTETEVILEEIWSEILGRSTIGVKDDFFELGGHSLKATRLLSQIHKRFEVKLELRELFTNTIIEKQADLIDNTVKNHHIAITPIDIQPLYDLSSSQKRLWILNQFKESNLAYNIPGFYEFNGELDISSFELSFLALIKRHEILRTIFVEDKFGDVKQVVLPKIDFKILYEDVSQNELEEFDIQKNIQNHVDISFDLNAGPLLRVKLFQLAKDKYILVYVLHHIISDDWSMGVLIKELLLFYNSYVKGEEYKLEPLKIQYKDYSAWQQNQLKSEALFGHKKYWLQQFEGNMPVLQLPTDHPRPLIKSYNGDIVHKVIDPSLLYRIKKTCQEKGATLFMGLLSVVNALLYKYTSQEDIIIGTPIAGREHLDLENQIGFYVNTLALRSQFNGTDGFHELLENVKNVTLGAYQHQMYPFDELVEDLQLQRDMSRNALFDVMVVLHNIENGVKEGQQQLENLKAKGYEAKEKVISKFDITFDFNEAEDGLHVSLEYNKDIFDKETIIRLANHFEQLLLCLLSSPDKPINQVEFISDNERNQLINKFNRPRVDYSNNKSILDLFEEQVHKTPDSTALVFNGIIYTYDDINKKANQLANYLKANYSIKVDELIAIKLERSPWLVISILGIFKSGGAYVPIDPDYPKDRINFILGDIKSTVLIDEKELEKFKLVMSNHSDSNTKSVIDPSNLAYVIYTSGSTGHPKGVLIEHHSLISKLIVETQLLGVDESIVGCLVTNYTFDVSLLDIFLPLINGGQLFIPTTDIIFSIESFIEYLVINNVTILQGTPGFINYLLMGVKEFNVHLTLPSLKKICIGGESLSQRLVNELREYLPEVEINNHYGPTEATIDSIVSTSIKHFEKNIIGRPIDNTTVYILDKNSLLLPIGVVGEICIGGDSLARGYHNDPELTDRNFITNPFHNLEKLYRTGDYGRWLYDGTIEFVGRMDEQVKIRGYRIELGEIEYVLKSHKLIDNAVVLVKDIVNEEKCLVCYVMSGEELNVTIIRSYLMEFLPSYMIPDYYVQVNSIPLTRNGKIDRNALIELDESGLDNNIEYEAPRDEIEKQIVNIWEEILCRRNIGITDNFFEVGGNSMKIIRLAKMLKLVLKKDISFTTLFQYPKIKDLVAYLNLDSHHEEDTVIDRDELISDLNKFNLD